MRFLEVQLYSDHIADQHHFYTQALGLPEVFADESGFAVQAGYTRLGFRQCIVVDQAQKEWFPAGIPAQAAPLACTFAIKGRQRHFAFSVE